MTVVKLTRSLSLRSISSNQKHPMTLQEAFLQDQASWKEEAVGNENLRRVEQVETTYNQPSTTLQIQPGCQSIFSKN